MADDPVVLKFSPANDGDHVIGIPARDLTGADVEELKVREPAAFANATAPHPITGNAIYQPAAQPKRAKADADAEKE